MPRPPVKTLHTLEQLAYALCGPGPAGGDLDRYPFAKRLLEAIAAAPPADSARLRAVFPRAVAAYDAWITSSAPPNTAALIARVDAELEAARADGAAAVAFPGGLLMRKRDL